MGIATALAASITRFTSFGLISLFFYGNHPVTVNPRICPPAIPHRQRSDGSLPSIRFFNRFFDRMDSAFDVTTTPFRNPFDGKAPRPMMLT